MNDYSHLSPSVIKEIVLFGLNLDEEVLKKYLKPRWLKYEEQWIDAIQQGIEKKATPDFVLAFYLLIIEPCARSKIKSTLNTSPRESEIVTELMPFHQDIRNLLEYARVEVFNFSPPMLQIMLNEKESYQILLEELTQVIRKNSSRADLFFNSRQFSFESPSNKTMNQLQEGLLQVLQQEKKEKKILILVNPDDLQRVMKTLLPHIDSGHEQTLYELLTLGYSAERIKFAGNTLQLGEIFLRFKVKGFLSGARFDTHLIEWLCRHFFFWNGQLNEFCPVTFLGIKKVFKENEKPKNPILLY